MITLDARGVNEAFYIGVERIKVCGIWTQTRNGNALEFPCPVTIVYNQPKERVIFYPQRDANPFFHLMEALWMLAGHNDVVWISKFNGRMNNYSDDGRTFHGAYGYRWRNWFENDQLKIIIHRLKNYPNDRRSVLTMWDPDSDLVMTNDGKDYPCNTQIYFSLRAGKLEMSVMQRSGDMIWGTMGANAVHMSYLQEYVAAMVGVNVGVYNQFTHNLHVYEEPFKKLDGMVADYDPYVHLARPQPLIDDRNSFDEELNFFMKHRVNGYKYKNQFLSQTAMYARLAWDQHKLEDKVGALATVERIASEDWRRACREWLGRRYYHA